MAIVHVRGQLSSTKPSQKLYAAAASLNHGLRIPSPSVDAKRTEGCPDTAGSRDNLDCRSGRPDFVGSRQLVYRLCSSETRSKETSGTACKGTAQKMNGSATGLVH